MLEYPSRVPPTTFESLHDWLKLLGEMVTAIVIMTTFASVIIGYIVITFYLSNFSVVISPLDTFSLSSIQIFMVFFLAILISAVVLFLFPLWATYWAPPETRESLPNLFGSRDIAPDTLTLLSNVKIFLSDGLCTSVRSI